MINTAPMEGVVDWHLREMLTDIGGLDRTVTEFVRVTDRVLPDHVFYRYAPELLNGSRTRSGVPVFVQLLGGQPQPMAENAAKVAQLGALGVDLNFGCPAKTVNRHDGGASLLKDPDRVFAVTSAVRQAVPPHLPVTVKVRLGFDHKDFTVAIAQAAQSGGAQLLTVHARTKVEMYQPPAHWEYIAQMRQFVSIPVVANGDIWTVEDYWRCREITGCEHVALGRGLIARPDLARQIQRSICRLPLEPLMWADVQNLLGRFYLRLKQHEKLALARTKQWCKFLARTYPEASDLFEQIKILNQGSVLQENLSWPMSLSTPGPSAPTAFAPNPC